MRVRVNIDRGRVRQLTHQSKQALVMTAEQLRTDLIQAHVMPFEYGTLQNVQTTIDEDNLNRGVVSIVHDTPYAERLYYHPEYNFNRETNAKARGEWWEPWLTGAKKSRPAAIYRAILRRLMGVQ